MNLAATGINMVDAFLLVVVLIAIVTGWRQGAVATLLALLGVVAGFVLGIEAAPYVMNSVEGRQPKIILGLGVVIFLIGLGHMVGAVAGQSLRNRLRTPLAVGADSGFGAVIQTMAALLLTWMIAIPLAAAVPGPLGNQIRESSGLAVVDKLAPQRAGGVLNDIMRQLRDDGMPTIAPPFGQQQSPMPDVPADPNVISQDVVDRIRPSIVRVMGEAPQCERLLQGSGFVIAPDLIVTNAHVVAGVQTVRLETVLGVADANVIHYDPHDDVALLRTSNLALEPLQWADQGAFPGDGAVVLGFPESGPFKAIPARVESRLIIRGPDIYDRDRLEREAYVLKSDVRHGNSGGPLITPDGKLLGLVFGAGINNDQTGYALTDQQVKPHIDQAIDSYTPVGTAECVAK